MINKLTLNGITIEYPSHMMVAINGDNIRLLPSEVNLIAIREEQQSAPEYVTEVHEPPPVKPVAPVTPKVMPRKTPDKRRNTGPFSETALAKENLPPHWKATVIKTLKEHDGSCYARMLSSRVFKGMGKITWGRATKLRRALRDMVDKGELLALGTASDRQSAQMLYGLPTEEEPRMTRSS